MCGPSYTSNKPDNAIIIFPAEKMGSRRLTIFPSTGDAGHEVATTTGSERRVAPISVSKRKFSSRDGIVDLELPRALTPARNMHRVFTPVDEDPERFYQCIYIVDPEGTRPYCLAQEKTLTTNGCIVMIRRSAVNDVVGTSKPNPNLLNVLGVFRYNESIFTVLDPPGLPLSDIAICHSPQLGLAQIQTISKEVIN
jgi:hypothetical protein